MQADLLATIIVVLLNALGLLTLAMILGYTVWGEEKVEEE